MGINPKALAIVEVHHQARAYVVNRQRERRRQPDRGFNTWPSTKRYCCCSKCAEKVEGLPRLRRAHGYLLSLFSPVT